MKNLAIFGPYPPPLGGISVHIKRLEHYLKEEGITYTIYNHGSFNDKSILATNKKAYWYLKLLFEPSHQLFHFHQFFYFHFFYYYFFSLIRKEPLIVTIHSERILNYKDLKCRVVIKLLSITKRLTLITVSKNLNQFLQKKGLQSIFLPAYVPPRVIKPIKIENGDSTFLFSVWKLDKELANKIYDVPLAFEFLRQNKHGLKMIFMIGNKKASNLKYLSELVSKYNIESKLFVVFDKNLIDFIGSCRFLLRPNIMDGYGVSIQEALDMGTPAIASNVCVRPRGTVLFEKGNLQDLNEKVSELLKVSKGDSIKEKEELTYHSDLIDIYLKNFSNETSHTKL